MKNLRNYRLRLALLALCVLGAGAAIGLVPKMLPSVSKPGEYRGYSEHLYGEWVRTSRYIPGHDGTRLAADIYRPARAGVAIPDRLPVVWQHERYQRATLRAGTEISTPVTRVAHLQELIKYGYVVGIVDARGSGGSFGTRNGPFSQREALDARSITEWFAAQPWCNGSIGMMGASYRAIAQYLAAATSPHSLKAIFPIKAMFDFYEFSYPGGIYRENLITNWSQLTERLDSTTPTVPVDDDHDGELLLQARAEHKGNQYPHALFRDLPYRDSKHNDSESMLHVTRSPSTSVSNISASGIPVYQLAGWYDIFVKDAFLWFVNGKAPQKITIGPWSHSDLSGFDALVEQLRWFDKWLKNIENGIMDEPPITYYTIDADEGKRWRQAWMWPLPTQKRTKYYFSGDSSGSIHSVNDGALDTQLSNRAGQDDYDVDYTTTSGTRSRWVNGYGGPFGYPDMRTNDLKALTYTTAPLETAVEVTGHPVMHLWIASTHSDVDVVAYLEEVDRTGLSRYVTEGALRASHRATAPAPFDNLGLPYHRSFAEDVSDLPDQPVELVFDMLPTSKVFRAGNRLRVAVACADRDNLRTREISPPPRLTVYRSREHASYIVLPIIPTDL